MEIVAYLAYLLRAFLNITASAILLAIGVLLFGAALDVPDDSSRWKSDGLGDPVLLAALAIFSGYLAVRFWRHQPKVNSSAVSAILNGLACLAFLSVITMYALNR